MTCSGGGRRGNAEGSVEAEGADAVTIVVAVVVVGDGGPAAGAAVLGAMGRRRRLEDREPGWGRARRVTRLE